MTEPGDELAAAAAGRGRVRASHADREQVIGTLKAAFVQGMLAKDEFDLRVGQTFASRTYAELAAVTADLPARLTAAQPPPPARAQGKARVLRPGAVLTAATVLYAAMWPLALSIHRNIEGNPVTFAHKLVVLSIFVYVLAAVLAVVRMQNSRQDRRSGGQRPWRAAPGTGGQASRHPPSTDPGGELSPVDGGQQHTAEAARSHHPARGHCPDGAIAGAATPALMPTIDTARAKYCYVRRCEIHAPLCRRHHCRKQSEGWRLEQPELGVLICRTPANLRGLSRRRHRGTRWSRRPARGCPHT
jgi:Domain of unknown function (DUF1707)